VVEASAVSLTLLLLVIMDLINLVGGEKSAYRGIGRSFCCGSDVWWGTDDNHVEDSNVSNRGIGKQYVTV